GLVYRGYDGEAVEDVESFGAFFPDELEIGLPHVRAYEGDLGNDLLAHGGKESLKGFHRWFLAHPEQAGDTDVDLVDQSQVLVAFGILNFIDTDGVNLTERAVRQPEGNDMFH